MIAMKKKVANAIFAGVLLLSSTSTIAWWNDNDRWRDGPWYGGYPGYGWGGYPGYGWGGYRGWGGYPGYGWGGYREAEQSPPPQTIE